jgi:hypothetical protein
MKRNMNSFLNKWNSARRILEIQIKSIPVAQKHEELKKEARRFELYRRRNPGIKFDEPNQLAWDFFVSQGYIIP